jgi:hypothetical protein
MHINDQALGRQPTQKVATQYRARLRHSMNSRPVRDDHHEKGLSLNHTHAK